MRLKSIQNIGKITKSMKMIASTKLNRAQKSMELARSYGVISQGKLFIDKFNIFTGFINSLEIEQKEDNGITEEGENNKDLIVVCSSDRGLCGAIHSSLSKTVKKISKQNSSTTQIAIIGDKAKPQIARGAKKNIIVSYSQVGKSSPSFSEAAFLTSDILSENVHFKSVKILYNQFQTVISYQNSFHNIFNIKTIREAPKMPVFAEIDEPINQETLQNFFEFNMANMLFWGLVEGYASEMASRRMAMENATKNSEQIVLGLTMKYNRTRQAVITNELVDIITGASAL